MSDKEAVQIQTAATMLDYDESTIRRKINAGDLEAFGSGRGRRVTIRSIQAYLNGERGVWRKSEKPTRAPTMATDQSIKRAARGASRADSTPATSPYAGVRPTARTPSKYEPS